MQFAREIPNKSRRVLCQHVRNGWGGTRGMHAQSAAATEPEDEPENVTNPERINVSGRTRKLKYVHPGSAAANGTTGPTGPSARCHAAAESLAEVELA